MGRSMDPEAPDLDLHESLSSEDRASALALVRDSVETFVREGRRLVPPPGSTLSRRQGPAFVTITLQGALRGCIGVLEPLGSLDQTLVQCAIAAASEDPRFPPLSRDELASAQFEISILSAPRQVGSPKEIEVGRHGLLIESSGKRGLLLPQVAVEHGWDRRRFLGEVCRKAGLSQDAWKRSDSRLWVFTAEVFGPPPD